MRPIRVASRSGHDERAATAISRAVTRLVSEGVIDVLEVVEIDEQGRANSSVAAVTGQELLDAIHDQRTVGEASERVVQCLVLQFAGPFDDQSHRPGSPRRQHEDKGRQHAGQNQPARRTGRSCARGTAPRQRDRECLCRPAVVEIDRRRLRVARNRSTGEVCSRDRIAIVERDRDPGVVLQCRGQ